MLVFIDESGDPGFKMDRGSSPVFAAVMVVFDDKAAALHADAVIEDALRDLRAFPEFKFNKCDDRRRDGFSSGWRDATSVLALSLSARS